MATKNKTKKKPAKSNRTAGKKMVPKKKRVTPKKKLASKKAVPSNVAVKTKGGRAKTTGARTAGAVKKRIRGESRSVASVGFARQGLGAREGKQSGDLQGLSNSGRADSESVDELLEEGNAFEAEAVKGVEDADNADEKEVRTHEVPQDDVPGEYQNKE